MSRIVAGDAAKRSSTIVVGGEALVDLVPSERRPLSPLTPRLGGGPFNVAVGLGRLAVPTTMLTRLSTDAFGDELLARLEQSGVDTTLIQRGDEPTTLSVVTLDPSGAARYSFHVEGSADRLVADPGPLPDDAVALALGTLSLLLEPGATVYADLALRAAADGLFVSLDPNIREALVGDPDAVRARLDAIAAVAGLVKLSDEDAAWWGREPADLVAAGAGAVVVTRGAEGLTAITATAEVEVPADTSRGLVDTIGAGDSVHAALLAHLAEHDLLSPGAVRDLSPEGWREALTFAARVGGWTVSRAGAEPPTRDELRT